MEFTYKDYNKLLLLLKNYEYTFCSYDDYKAFGRSVILRHDIDNSILAAIRLAEIEQLNNVSATYFLLLTSDFYNIFSLESKKLIQKLINCGATIGLHFDEAKYGILTIEQIREKIKYEAKILENELCINITSISMHRPSEIILNSNVKLGDYINAYSDTYIKDYKYLSDSRMHWRESVEELISTLNYDRLHILTHAIWYNDIAISQGEVLKKFINGSKERFYYALKCNIRDLDQIITLKEIG